MNTYKATIFLPYGDDSINPYYTLEIKADSIESAKSKANVIIRSNKRTQQHWQDAKIIKII